MPLTKYMRSLEIGDGKIKFERKLVKRSDGSGYLINLPKFVGDFGQKGVIEVDIIKKEVVIKFS